MQINRDIQIIDSSNSTAEKKPNIESENIYEAALIASNKSKNPIKLTFKNLEYEVRMV
jgi:hypothetical protein